MIQALYIHIPFCRKICRYCDFPKMVLAQERHSDYMDALIRELTYYEAKLQDIDTIYIGGGTPSMLIPDQLERLLDQIHRIIDIERIKEFSIEANPNDVRESFVELIKRYGINRVSLGVQSFDPQTLSELGRTHHAEDVFRAVRLLQKYMLYTNIDLIHGSASQSVKTVRADMETALQLHVEHLSCYDLILEHKTQLHHDFLHQRWFPPSEEVIIASDILIEDMLKLAGYGHYEVSNYALPGHECLHHLHYWNLDEYLGLGMAAASQYDQKRLVNPTRIKGYIDSVMRYGYATTTTEPFDPEMEFVMLGLRKLSGISKRAFHERFGTDVGVYFPRLSSLLQGPLIVECGDQIKLTPHGIRLANQVYLELFEEVLP